MERIWKIFIPRLHIAWFLWLCYVGYYFFLDKQSELEQYHAREQSMIKKVARKKRESKKMKEYLKDVEKAKKRIETVALQVEKLQKKLPVDISDAKILDYFITIAKKLRIKDFTSEPAGEVVKGFYIVREYNFKMSGTYLQLLVFFEQIAKSEQLLNIKMLKIAQSEKQTKSRFGLIDVKGILESYRYNKNHREDRGIDAIESQYK
jgi:Tfp pilus assembly protein PilO